tara:strand:- start:6456 stop:7199 length:744 start_codon:yes stop_codon:yes gene_type:complete
MFYFLSKILVILIKPTVWLFLLMLAAIVSKKKRKKILFVTFILFYILTNSFLADNCAKMWEAKDMKLKNRYDVGIVLGGISNYDSQKKIHNFNKHADRLMYAEQLYRRGVIKKILLSGGNGMLFSNGYKEAESMKHYLLKNNIPEKDLIIEKKSRNTKENASYTAKILKNSFKEKKFLLITSAIHIKRAKFCFDKSNITVDYLATDRINSNAKIRFDYLFIPQSRAIEVWEELIHEWFGYISYKLFF